MQRSIVILGALLALGTGTAAAQQPSAPVHITLFDAIRTGAEHAASAASARNSARAASARIGQRRADLLPQIGANASWTRQTVNLDEFGISFPGVPQVTPDFTVWRAQVTARQTLFDASALARVSAAKDNAAAAGLDARAAAEHAGAVAGYMYLRVLGADETVRARLQDSVVSGSLLLQARRLVDAGVSPAIDATRSEVNFAAVRTQLELARNAAGRARLDLAAALDLSAGTVFALEDSLGTPPVPLPDSPDTAVAFALEHRTDLAAERVRTAGQRRSLGAIRRENLPSVALSGSYQQGGRETDNLAGSYSLQLGVTVPILDGLRRQARAGEQVALLDVQQDREHQAMRMVETEVRQAWLDIGSAREQLRIAAERVRLSDAELAQAQQRFESGVSGSVETTQSQGANIQAHDAMIQARFAYAISRLAAYRALGVLDQLR